MDLDAAKEDHFSYYIDGAAQNVRIEERSKII